jgi:nucleoside-diphosphate-sugar epimerase
MGKVAFITGGNGITGSAILEHLVKHTTSEQWSKIIVTSRSPFKTHLSDPRIVFIALDFSKPSSELAPSMKDICSSVTHSYFSSYVHKDDFVELNKANLSLFENFLTSLTEVAPHLENVTLQTGGKYYNVHLRPVPSPAREEDPRLLASADNFYYPQEDFLTSKQKGSKWSYNIIRPQAIIGSTHTPNGMNSALTFAIYFLTCKELGTTAPMPTNHSYWNGYDDFSYAPLIADLTIFASTHPKCANEAFNCVNGDVVCWRYMWPRLAAYFGVKAAESGEQVFKKPRPEEGSVQLELSLAEWSQGKREVWDKLCKQTGSEKAKKTFDFGTWGFQDWVFQRTWSSGLSINKARRYGWTGHVDSYECLIETFEKFERLGLVPPRKGLKGVVNGGT